MKSPTTEWEATQKHPCEVNLTGTVPFQQPKRPVLFNNNPCGIFYVHFLLFCNMNWKSQATQLIVRGMQAVFHPLGLLQSVHDDATDPLSGTTSSSTNVPGWEMPFAAQFWNTEIPLSVTFSDLYLTRLTIKPKIGGYAKCVCSPCLLLAAHNWALYTLPPVILAPTATGIIAHVLLPLCIWLQWQRSCPSMSVSLAPGVSAWSNPMTWLVCRKSYVFVELVESNSYCIDLTLAQL